jgi:uncharacterized membrane protein YqjE
MATPTPPSRPSGPQAVPDVDVDPKPDPTLGELIGRTTSDLSELLRDELELAKVELKEEAKTVGKASALVGAAGLTAYLAVALLCFAAAWGLSEVVPEGIAFLIVGLVVGAVAAVMFLLGRNRFEHFEPVPRQTVETIQEDVQWAKQLKS